MKRLGIVLSLIVTAVLHAQSITKQADPPKPQRSGTGATQQTSSALAALPAACDGGARSVTVPFVLVAEYRGTRNQSRHYAVEGRQYADDDSYIVVCFDKDALVRDRNYSKGRLSLEARLESRDGTRAVEVSNYTTIGESPKTYQATVRTATIIPDYQSLARRLRNITSTDTDVEVVTKSEFVLQTLDLLTAAEKADITAEFLGVSPAELNDFKQRLSKGIAEAKAAVEQAKKATQEMPAARADLDAARNAVAAARVAVENATRNRDQARVSRDNVLLEQPPSQDRIDNAQRQFEAAEAALANLQRQVVERSELLQQKEETLRVLSEGTQTQQLSRAAAITSIRDVVRDLSVFLKPEQAILPAIISLTNLRNGVIDLKTQSAKPGERLIIALRHYDTPGKPDDFTPVPVMDVYIADFGVSNTVADSFLLVKREHEPKNDASASPSNFKGAAGISLLWRNTARPTQSFVRLFDGVSWGLNVSYLDFDATKEIELGAGLVVGFFRDQVHVGCGRNLNVARAREYCFLGFSFAKIKENMTGKGEE